METKYGDKKSDIWSINSILCSIFAYSDHKDLIKFNTVCKKWNSLTNPTIHRKIKLIRNWDIIERTPDKTIDIAVKVDPEVEECIANNSKYASFVKEFKFNYRLESQRAIEFFETFRFISSLIIDKVHITQDQFLGMISSLNQLQELNISNLTIINSFRKISYKEAIQLPPSLRRLRLEYISLIDNPELFIKTINSHKNLIDFSFSSCSSKVFLKPFYKPYPNLVNFEATNKMSRSSDFLIKIFKNNPQLISSKISPRYLDSELISDIKKYLSNLQEFIIVESKFTIQNFKDIYLMFSQSTKIKKLVLILNNIRNRSLDPILLNSPYLEELDLNGFKDSDRHESKLFILLSKSVNVKKLAFNCENLSESMVDTFYLSFPNLNELNIYLSVSWREEIKSIYERCENLQKLTIRQPDRVHVQKSNNFYQEFYETDLFTRNPKCKSTLTHLTLDGFKAINSKAKHFQNFEKLKSIKYPKQNYRCLLGIVQKTDIDIDLWPGYVVFKNDNEGSCDIELKRL